MQELLNLITSLKEQERKKLFSWVATLPEELRIEIFQDAVKKSFQLKVERPDLSGKLNKYCSFVLAARRAGYDTVTGKGYRVADKAQFDDFSHMRKAKAADIINKGRTPALRRKILAHLGEIEELKADGVGFRPIAEYLHKHRKVKTSASYLARMWKEVENDKLK